MRDWRINHLRNNNVYNDRPDTLKFTIQEMVQYFLQNLINWHCYFIINFFCLKKIVKWGAPFHFKTSATSK